MSDDQQPQPQPDQAQAFFQTLSRHKDFGDMVDDRAYRSLPEDWLVGVADIVNSTKLLADGRYKVVNTVGAAVISAQMNGAQGSEFPFVFGGDGAAFAIWPQQAERAQQALAAVLRWAKDEFDIEMRGALVPIRDIRDAGFDVALARFDTVGGVDYAMFQGGGVTWAEDQMKAGRYAIDPAPVGTLPDLEGLSCRWTAMRATNGHIVSMLILPGPKAEPVAFAGLCHRVVNLVEGLERSGSPLPADGPGYSWPPEGLELEARASHGDKPLWRRKLELYIGTFMALIFFKTGWKAGAFDPAHYVAQTRDNADFRKIEDGLKMTIDCDEATLGEIEALLAAAAKDGLVHYGIHKQDEALMTCIVPSVTRDDHVHFIDGAAGGYTMAASMAKSMAAAAKG